MESDSPRSSILGGLRVLFPVGGLTGIMLLGSALKDEGGAGRSDRVESLFLLAGALVRHLDPGGGVHHRGSVIRGASSDCVKVACLTRCRAAEASAASSGLVVDDAVDANHCEA